MLSSDVKMDTNRPLDCVFYQHSESELNTNLIGHLACSESSSPSIKDEQGSTGPGSVGPPESVCSATSLTNGGTPDQGGQQRRTGSKRRREDKQCAVCGDRALGFNFGAITCESCKAFFRRNALKPEVPVCMFSESCSIGTNTRRFCTFCRLKKCYDASMKKEYILGEDQKRQRQAKVRENREKRLKVQLVDDFSTTTDISSYTSAEETRPAIDQSQIPPPSDPKTDDFPSGDTKVEGGLPLTVVCSPNTRGVVLSESSQLTTVQQHQILSPKKMPDDKPYVVTGEISINNVLVEDGHARLLTQEQWSAVNDLHQAYDMSFINSSNDRGPDENFTLNNLINTSGFIVRKLINFAKKLADFSILSQDCQISLLKGVVLNTLFLRSANHYDVVKDVWITPNGEIPTRILKVVTGLDVLYEEHAKYCRSFRSLVGHDSSLIALMQVLCLFSPERPNVKDRQQVSNVHDRYILLLKHYLEARYGYSEARTMLALVLSNLAELQRLTDNHGSILLQVDPNKVDPLMLEVFSLNDSTLLSYYKIAHPVAAPSAGSTTADVSTVIQAHYSAAS